MSAEKEIQVKKANKIFYDTVADVYEKVDGRRSEDVSQWLDNSIEDLSKRTGGGSILDLGCGTGFVMRKARKCFEYVYGTDISHNVLKTTGKFSDGSVCADGAYLPFRTEVFDAVACLAVLHHCYDHCPLFHEAYRILKKGGVLYTDHDIDRQFVHNFHPILRIYRNLFDTGKGYLQEKKELTRELYELSEIHSDGIETVELVKMLKEAGFRDVKIKYHWIGLSKRINTVMKLMGNTHFPRGFAPNISILATK